MTIKITLAGGLQATHDSGEIETIPFEHSHPLREIGWWSYRGEGLLGDILNDAQ